jgi:hypothetical protein
VAGKETEPGALSTVWRGFFKSKLVLAARSMVIAPPALVLLMSAMNRLTVAAHRRRGEAEPVLLGAQPGCVTWMRPATFRVRPLVANSLATFRQEKSGNYP